MQPGSHIVIRSVGGSSRIEALAGLQVTFQDAGPGGVDEGGQLIKPLASTTLISRDANA
jgi:hypothetical protein